MTPALLEPAIVTISLVLLVLVCLSIDGHEVRLIMACRLTPLVSLCSCTVLALMMATLPLLLVSEVVIEALMALVLRTRTPTCVFGL